MHKTNTRKKNRGFTLIELLVALMIFSVLSVMAYSGLNTVLKAKTRTEQQASQLSELQLFLSILSRDIEQIVARPVRGQLGDQLDVLIGNNTTIEFTKTGRRNPAGFPRSHLQRIAYGQKDAQFIRMAWQVLDRTQASEPYEALALNALKSFEVRFLDNQAKWHTQWPDNLTQNTAIATLPVALELTLEFEKLGSITRLFRIPSN